MTLQSFPRGQARSISSIKFISDASINLVLTQSVVKMTGKTFAGVCASKTKEHVALSSNMESWERGSGSHIVVTFFVTNYFKILT
jgi:hypothetical protein